jgi:26S proteasome regulatory subunit N8
MTIQEEAKEMELEGSGANAALNGDESNPLTTPLMRKLDISEVIIHPLVLLSVADHYHRVARGTRKRVVGVLVGQVLPGGRVDATNSFAVPFEEDTKNPVRWPLLCACPCRLRRFITCMHITHSCSFFVRVNTTHAPKNHQQAVFYLDHNFLENMLAMFRKVNAKERVIGFYSSGPQIRPNDLRIHDIVERFTGIYTNGSKDMSIPCHPAVFCIIDVRPGRVDLPVTSYKVIEEVEGVGKTIQRTFAHVASYMGAMEAEEVGVEHLLRDVHDPTVSSVASLIQGKLTGLATLQEKLVECKDYLEQCASGDVKINVDILDNLQTILSLLPNLNTPKLINSMMILTNDMHMAIYIASLIRTVIALHDLVNNKIRYGEDGMEEQQEVAAEEKKSDDKDPKKEVSGKTETK